MNLGQQLEIVEKEYDVNALSAYLYTNPQELVNN